MHARVSTFEGGDPNHIDPGVLRTRKDVLPAARELEGFKGVISLADRETGEEMTITLWASEDAMRASEEAANSLREQTLSEGERIAAVRRFEVTMLEVEAPQPAGTA